MITAKSEVGAGDASFEANYRKLLGLSEELQQNKIGIDELVPRIQQALTSLKVCKDVLQKTKAQLNQVTTEFAELESKE